MYNKAMAKRYDRLRNSLYDMGTVKIKFDEMSWDQQGCLLCKKRILKYTCKTPALKIKLLTRKVNCFSYGDGVQENQIFGIDRFPEENQGCTMGIEKRHI